MLSTYREATSHPPDASPSPERQFWTAVLLLGGWDVSVNAIELPSPWRPLRVAPSDTAASRPRVCLEGYESSGGELVEPRDAHPEHHGGTLARHPVRIDVVEVQSPPVDAQREGLDVSAGELAMPITVGRWELAGGDESPHGGPGTAEDERSIVQRHRVDGPAGWLFAWCRCSDKLGRLYQQ